ncbi:hypothetical protein DICPUDRAFT_46762 [Dictyostelium purpureum]|uniref:MARVEL domain-containing protein n=1 Tax=Dictyostelium purpureum TaxID=5786 RepID=F0ZG59_DICPU|nr:uncharacterized protein DICPUDRAFT_46762 [Dictyostelium purpureum]EGC37065.1 hypothetical protein DICPUDRAFT_46762 [Dictyostelium purpureum]|eukprot:XP_003286422.1 hypothetical protein DICPUDRAFT_46762 [Dictyostelium purpureum]
MIQSNYEDNNNIELDSINSSVKKSNEILPITEYSSSDNNSNSDSFNYKSELKTLKINYSILVFVLYVMLSIFFGGMMIGLPWFSIEFFNSSGVKVCEKEIHLGSQKPPLQKFEENQWDNYHEGYQVLTVFLVSTVLLFIDVLMVIPVLFFKNYFSLIPDIVYYILDWILIIVALSTYKSYYFIPKGFAIDGCSSNRATFENHLSSAFYFAIARAAALKLLRIVVSVYFVYKVQQLKQQKHQNDQPHEKSKSFTNSICVKSFHDLKEVGGSEC